MTSDNRARLLLTLAVLFWAGNFILGRAFHTEIPPISLAFWRWLGAAILITGPAMPHLRRDRLLLIDRWPVVLLLAVLGIAAFNTLVYTGLQYTQAINAFLIQTLMPIAIVILSFLFFRESVSRVQALGVLVSLAGAVLIIVRGEPDQMLTLSLNRGDLLVAAAILCYAGYSVALRKCPQTHPFSLLCTIFWLGTVLLAPLYVWEVFHVGVMALQLSHLLVIAYVMIFPSILSYLCYNRGVLLIGANRAGLFIHLMPVFGSLMAVLFLGETFRWFHGAGIILIGVGIYLATRVRLSMRSPAES